MHNNFSVKVLLITSFPVLSALLFGITFRSFIHSAHLGILIATVIAGLVFLATLTIFSILETSHTVTFTGFALATVAMAAPFIMNTSIILLVGVAIAFIMFALSHRQTQHAVQNNVKVKFWHIAHISADYASSGMAIFAILAYLSLLNFSDPSSLKKTLEAAIRPMEPIFYQYIPGFTIRSTITQIAASLLPDDLKLAPPEIKSQVIQQAAQRLSATLAAYIKVPISAGDKVIDIVYKATLGKILNYSPVVRSSILVVSGFFIFILLKFILIFVNWISIALAFGIYRILLATKFLEVQLQSIEKEVIVVK